MFAYYQNNYQVAKLFFCQLQPFTQKYKDTIGFGEFHKYKKCGTLKSAVSHILNNHRLKSLNLKSLNLESLNLESLNFKY